MLWMITDFSRSANIDEVKKDIENALNSGVGNVSLRNNGKYTMMQILDLAVELSQKYPEKDIFVHNPDDEAVKIYNKFHFSERFFNRAVDIKRQKKQCVVAVSLHVEYKVKEAFLKDIDYIFYSPVYQPISKPEDNRKTVEPISMKNLYLLGGINRMRGRSLIERGFTNIAGISLFYGDTADKDISELSELIKEKCR